MTSKLISQAQMSPLSATCILTELSLLCNGTGILHEGRNKPNRKALLGRNGFYLEQSLEKFLPRCLVKTGEILVKSH